MAVRRLKAILEAVDKASPTLSRVSRTLTVLGSTAAFVGAVQLGRKLSAGMQVAIQKSAEQELSEKKLSAALQTTGQFSDELFEKLKKQAAGLQAVTDVGDETILEMQALLLQFGTGTEVVTELSEATLDLAKTFNTDFNSAATLVAKAVAGNVGALSRYGAEVDATRLKTDGAVEVLRALNDVFAGRARAEAATYTGTINRLNNAVGDLQESVGGPLRDVFTIFTDRVLIPTVTNIDEGVKSTDAFRVTILLTSAATADLAANMFALGSALEATGVVQKVVAAGIAITGTQTLVLNTLLGTLADHVEANDNAFGAIAERLRAFAEGAREAAYSGDTVAASMQVIGETIGVASEQLEEFADLVEDRIPMVAENFAVLPEIMDRWQLTNESVMAQSEALMSTFREQTRTEIGMAQERTKWSQWERDKKIQHGSQAAASAGGALRTLFGDTKAGAYASAIVNTAQAITNGLATPPPPLGIALAAIMAAAGAKQLSDIRKAKFGGAARGGIVPGADRGVDSVVGLLRPGEMVLPREVSNALLQASGGNQTVMLDISADSGDLAEILSIRVRNGSARLEATELTGSAVRR